MNFRYKAMQKMRAPDELDSPSVLAAPRGWIAVMVVLIVAGFAVGWGFLGQLPVDVNAPGALSRPGGTGVVQSPFSGTVVDVVGQSGKTVRAGETIVTVQGPDGVGHAVKAPYPGTLINIAVSDGAVIGVGTTVVTLEHGSPDSSGMVAMLFVPDTKAIGLKPGNLVSLDVSSAPSRAFGLLRGRIASVSEYSLTSGQIAGLVGGDLAANRYLKSGPPRLVIVDLLRDAKTPSGYAWSSRTGAPFRLTTQIAVTGTINLQRQTPFGLLFGQ